MARATQTGPLIGNYVSFLLRNRDDVGNNDTAVDTQIMPMAFRVSAVNIYGLGTTATITVTLKNVARALDVCSATLTNDTISSFTPDTLTNTDLSRNIPAGGGLQLDVSSNGTGLAPPGYVAVVVTGYFNDGHITNHHNFREHGQAATVGPAAGYYDVLPFTNVRVNGPGQATRAEYKLNAPYNCRTEAISFMVHGETLGLSDTLDVYLTINGVGSLQSGVADMSSTGADLVQIKAVGTTPTLSAIRNITRGDRLEMRIATGANDVVPVMGMSGYALVWVQGHVTDDWEVD